MEFKELRKKHPVFHYEAAKAEILNQELVLSWQFYIEPDLRFSPKTVIKFPSDLKLQNLPSELLEKLAFYTGLVEMLSYWKASCSPVISVEAGKLSQAELPFWEKLLQQGLSEFFFINKIDLSAPDLVAWENTTAEAPISQEITTNDHSLILPIGGGKDSALSVALIKNQPWQVRPFLVNPTPAAQKVAENLRLKPVVVHRQIDPKLLELNQQGYLNGHTPFSALLGWLGSIAAALTGSKYVAVSNEQSANECNIIYQGVEINHQYSKTSAYETDFREYLTKYVLTGTEYFSFLRPLNELQIAQKFSKYPQFFSDFRSCNRGQKTNTWCHECPKCLFTYIMLFPFIDYETLTTKIFSHDLFANEKLVSIARELITSDLTKPFECVGSYDESLTAMSLARDWYLNQHKPVPNVLALLENELLPTAEARAYRIRLLNGWVDQHHIPLELQEIIKQ